MKIINIRDCSIKENPNYEKMSEGRQFVNIMLETDKGTPFSIDICYTESGTIKFQAFPISQGKMKWYEKTIELNIADGITISDKLKNND